MESIAERVGSNRSSSLRRYHPVQSRMQCWSNGRMISDGQPQLDCQVPRELAYQAQIAACNYLGYSPREFSTSQFRHQALLAEPSRPLELHMHHHHHHYLASPTSPFSHTNSAASAPFFGEPGLAATADFSIRNSSPVPSHLHSESNQMSAQNVLCLKNQPDGKVLKEGGLVKRDYGSQLSNTTDLRSIQYTNKLSWSKDYDSEQQQRSEREVNGYCRPTFAPLKTCDVSSFRDAETGGYQSPYGSQSDETSATEESVTPTIYETRPTSQRSFRSVVDPWRAKCLHGTEKEDRILGEVSVLDREVSQAAERPLAIGAISIRHASKPHSNGVGEVNGSSKRDDMTTSGSEKVSGVLCNWACVCPVESKNQEREYCPPTRAARKNFGGRVSRRQASREARTWEYKERRTFKGLCHEEARDDETKKHPRNHELESQVEVGKMEADVSRCAYEHEGVLPPGDRRKEVLDWHDADKLKFQKVGKQPCLPCLQPEASKTEQHVKGLDSPPPHGNGVVEDILDEEYRRGTERLKSEYLQDPPWRTSVYTPWTNDLHSKYTSQNRFREAVEEAWKTSLGTKRDDENDDLRCDTPSDVGGASRESRQATVNSQIVARVASDHSSSPIDDTERVADEDIREMLDERAYSRAKFKEELEQGVTDRLRLQELLQLEKFKLETTERELREVKRSFQDALIAREKANKKHTCELILEHQSENSSSISGVVEGRADTQLKLKSESVTRIAAEAKTSYFEASAKAADEKMHSLMKERDLFYSRFKEQLEHNNSDTTASKQLMEQGNACHEESESPLKRKLDAGARVASTLANKPSHSVAEDGDRVAQNGTQNKAAYHARLKQELEEEDADRHRLHRLLEMEESRRGLVKGTEERSSMLLPVLSSSKQGTSPILTTEKGVEHEPQRKHSSSLIANSDYEKQLKVVSAEPSNLKNERQGSFSPTSMPSVQKWESDFPFSVKIERCRLEGGKTTTTFDISPDLDRRGNSPYKNGCKLELRHGEDTESTDCTDNSSSFGIEAGEDEELVSCEVRSYTYDISGEQDEHVDAGGEEDEGTKSQGAGSESDQNSVDRRDRSYPQSESDRSKEQSDLSPAEGTSTSICSEEPDTYGHEESNTPKRNLNARAEGTPSAELYVNTGDAERHSSADRSAKHAERCEANSLKRKIEGFDDSLMSLPSKWKRAAKAELRRIIQEQELTWKIAEDAVDELGRRLELLETYKMELQDNLSRRRVRNDRERFWTRLEMRSDDSPRGFSSSYQSPIFDNRLGPVERETSGRTSRQADNSGATAHESHQSNDLEIQKLKADIEDLKKQLCKRRSSRANSPMKVARQLRQEDFQYSSSSSPPTPLLPPPPATPATPPTVPDYQHHAFQVFSNGRRVPLARGPEHVCTGSEVVGFLETEKVRAPAENVKIGTSQPTGNKRNGYSSRKEEGDRYHEDPVSEESRLGSRTWVSVPEGEGVERKCLLTSDLHENGEKNPWAMEQNYACVKFSRVHDVNRSGNNNITSCKLNLDEGEVEEFKDAVRQISNVFWQQEGKLKSFKGAVNMTDAGHPSPYIEMRNFYVNLLKEMSVQLGELCRDLQTDSCENVHSRESLIRPLHGGSEVENLRATLEAAERQIEEEVNINQLLKEKLDAGDKHISKIVEEHAEELMRKEKTVSFAERLNLQLVNEMSVTESSLAELRERYKGLVTNLESQLKGAREEVTDLQSTLSDLKLEVEKYQSLVMDLERAGKVKEVQIQELTERMQAYQSQTERNQSLVADLERAEQGKELQIEELTERMQAYQTDKEGNHNLIIDLERVGQEKELLIEELSERMQAYQSETDQMSEEKFELLKNIQELRRVADSQQHRVVELVNINDELMEFAQSKEDEVNALTKEVMSLQQVSKGKSDEANKLAVEAAISLRELIEARREGETYRVCCQHMKSKLEDTEQELMAREDALERLTRHLGSTIEGQDTISEEKEQLLLSLSKAQYKEHRMDDQIKQSKVIIQDLEEKMSCMEEELIKARIVMTEMRVKGEENLAIEKEAGEMRCRVHQLEEEIMEKEGQISILKSSYPGEFESTF